jgi:hypothetical protein
VRERSSADVLLLHVRGADDDHYRAASGLHPTGGSVNRRIATPWTLMGTINHKRPNPFLRVPDGFTAEMSVEATRRMDRMLAAEKPGK